MMPPLHGLVLAGGKSTRMGRDKASMVLRDDGVSQARRSIDLLTGCCEAVHLSLRDGQPAPEGVGGVGIVRDSGGARGPLAGILAALESAPGAAWLVLACDLPFVTPALLAGLVRARRVDRPFVAYASAREGLPEPLCAVYESRALPVLRRHAAEGRYCPRRIMIDEDAVLLPLPERCANALANINAPADLVTGAAASVRTIRVAWFGRLAEARGVREEVIDTRAATARDFLREVEETYSPGLDERVVRLAVNDEFAAMDHPLCDGDKVVFLTPFSGG